MTSKGLISIHNLSKFYGNTPALNNVNLELKSGKIIGLLGPNGSGKTTLIKIINGLLKSYQGSLTVDDQVVGAHSKSLISYLPDESYFSDWMKIKDAINLFRDLYVDFDVEKCLNLIKRLGLRPELKIKTMSKGMKEKFQLALVMSRKAKIYILDEPIGGVDPAARELILDIILNNYSKDSLIILSTHLITDIEKIFDEIIFLKDGSVVLHRNAEDVRLETGKSIDENFKEVFKC